MRLIEVSVVLALITVAGGVQVIVEHPQNITARLGDTVVLKCRVENQKGTLQWVKNGFGLGTTRDLPLFERYDMVGKLTLGEYHLRIRNISVEDDDLYECQLSPTDNEPIQRSQAAALSVLAEPSGPALVDFQPAGSRSRNRISPDSLVTIVEAVEDGALKIGCRSTGSRPPARIAWAIAADSDAQQIVSYITSSAEEKEAGRSRLSAKHPQRGHAHSPNSQPQRPYVGQIDDMVIEDDNFYTVTSNLTFAPTKTDNTKFLACIVKHETLKAQKSAAVALDVSYRPKIRIEVDDRNSSLMEGGRAVFRCHVDARPSHDLTVKWSWNGGEPQRLIVLEQQNAMISGLRLRDNGAEVICTATNSIGTESASQPLNIPYGPRFLSRNQTRLVQRGDAATFECAAAGNPPPEIRWYRAGSRDFIATGVNYTISDVQEVDAGNYRCVATVAGFAPQALVYRLYIKGPPVVYLNPTPEEAADGDVILNCEIQTRVFPLKIVWLYNDRALLDAIVAAESVTPSESSTSDKRARLETTARVDGVASRLRLARFDASAHGIYRCVAHNEYGGAHDERDMARRSAWQRVVDLSEALPSSYRIAVPVGVLSLVVCALLICSMCCCANHNFGAKSKRRCCRLFCCCGTPSKSSNYSHDNTDDVVVKCEALDGAQFYPELYGRSDFVYTKDYVSVPQSNPDLDYVSNTVEYGCSMYGAQRPVGNGSHQTFMTNSTPLYSSDDATHYGNDYNSQSVAYGNGHTVNDTPANGMPGYYGISNGYYGAADGPLETLMEVTTPDTDGGEPPTVGDASCFGRSTIASEVSRRQQQYLATNGQLPSQLQTQDRPVSRVSTHV